MSEDPRTYFANKTSVLVNQLNKVMEEAYAQGVLPSLAVLHTPVSVCPARDTHGLPRCHNLNIEWYDSGFKAYGEQFK